MWSKLQSMRENGTIGAAVVGLIAIWPIIVLPLLWIQSSADGELARVRVAAPISMVCEKLSSNRFYKHWFPWFAEADKVWFHPPKHTMFTFKYNVFAFNEHSSLHGKAFKFNGFSAKCKSNGDTYKIAGDVDFGPKPESYWLNHMTQYRMEFLLTAHEGFTEVVANVMLCSAEGNAFLPDCRALWQTSHELFEEPVASGLQTFKHLIEPKTAGAPRCGGGSKHPVGTHVCLDDGQSQPADHSPAATDTSLLNYVGFLLLSSLVGAILGIVYHFARSHLARVPDQLFDDETWNKATSSQYAFEKDVLGVEHDTMGYWHATSLRNMAICVIGGATVPMVLGLLFWSKQGAILSDACYKLNLFHLSPMFCT